MDQTLRLAPNNDDNDLSILCDDLFERLWEALSVVSSNQLSTVGIALGRTLRFRKNSSWTELRQRALPSDLSKAAVLQGLTLVVPLMYDEDEDDTCAALEELMDDCQQLVVQATDPEVRLSALKGIRTLLSRIHTALSPSANEKQGKSRDRLRQTVHQWSSSSSQPGAALMEVILQAWENPPTRKLASALPALFESWVRLVLLVLRQQQQQNMLMTY